MELIILFIIIIFPMLSSAFPAIGLLPLYPRR